MGGCRCGSKTFEAEVFRLHELCIGIGGVWKRGPMFGFGRGGVKGDDVERTFYVQFAWLPIGAGAVVIVDAKCEIAGLLYFVNEHILA